MGDEDWLTLSSLEHFAYCPTQASLLQEGVWVDNHLTVQGSASHERVDLPGVDRRRGVRVHHRVSLASHRLLLHGIADAVEQHPDGAVMPVEHKWGRGSGDLWPSTVQVVGQAVCLEEMLRRPVPRVAIFIVSERRRVVLLTDDWRKRFEDLVLSARAALFGERVSTPSYSSRRCRRCSLLEACQPIGSNR